MARERPLTRAESQERTRRALLAAAERRFLDHGYFATTLTEIAADAGVTKGAVYANFASKADLFQEVRTGWARQGIGGLVEMLDAVDDVDTFVEVGVAWMVDFGTATEPRQRAVFEFLVEAEGTAASRHFVEVFQGSRVLVRQLVLDNVPRLTGRVVDPEQVALQVEVFLAALRGVAVHRQIDPSISVEAYGTGMRNLISGVIASSRAP